MIFFVIWKIKNWIENCPKSTFIFLKLLKIEQKWNGRFRTRMKTNFKKQKWISKKKKNWISKNSFIFQFLFWNWKMKNEKLSKFILFLNQKTNYTFCTWIVGRKRHSIFVLEWNRNLSFFRFSFSLSNRKTNFKSQFWYSIKIEKWISVRFSTKFFLCPNTLLISHIT